MDIGNRVFSKINRPDPELIQKFAGLPSSNINDEMNRLFCMQEKITLLNPETAKPLLGPAFTVKVPIGDNLMFHIALDMVQPGDVIVIDAGGWANRSIAGEIMLRMCQNMGIAGVIVDGCLRDLDGIKTLEMPVYACGITPQGPYKNGPGEINVPIACGGQVVYPGDIIAGDADGIVVIHKQDAARVADVAIKKKAGEDATFAMQASDFEGYRVKHKGQTEKMMEGHAPVFVDDATFVDTYEL